MRRILVIACALLAAEAATFQNYERPNNNNQGYSISGSLRSPDLGVSVSSTSPQDQTALNGASFQTTSGFEQSSTSGHHDQQSIVSVLPSVSNQINPSFSNEQLPSSNQDQVSVAEQSSFNDQESLIQQSIEFSSSRRSDGDCPEGQLRHFDGSCVTPEISRNVFVYAAPERDLRDNLELANIPKPKIEHNIVFIRTDELQSANDPIVVPPPQRRHVIYVLNQQSPQIGGQKIIEVTTPEPKTPEVYFVNYADGETPTLLDGIDFETALNSAVHAEGQVISGSNNFDDTERDNFNINVGVSSKDFGSDVTQPGNAGNFVTTSESVVNGNIGSTDFSVNVAASIDGPTRSDNEGYNINAPTSNANFNLNSNVAEAGASAQETGDSFNTFQASTSAVAPAPQLFYSSP